MHSQRTKHGGSPWTLPTAPVVAALAVLLGGCSLEQTALFDPDGDGVLVGQDCNDQDPGVGALYLDDDGDGVGGSTLFVPKTSSDCSTTQAVSTTGDCDDTLPGVYPGAAEVCDRVDQDCNERVDDNATDAQTWYPDTDRDSFGDGSAAQRACADQKPSGSVSNGDDCNDSDKNINPAEDEVCDGVDQDCDQVVDEEPRDGDLYYPDSDQDGSGATQAGERYCPDLAPEGMTTTSGDCNDNQAAIHPGVEERCDTVDNNCNGTIDEDPIDGQTYFRDADLDGYGDPSQAIQACRVSTGLSANNQDCDDLSAQVHPGATEICNGRDEDCDALQDEGLPDTDGTGYPDCTEVAYIVSVGFQENGDIQGCGSSTNILAQQAKVEEVLEEQGLHLVTFADDHVTGLDSSALLRYPLVIYDNGGWTDTLIPDSVDALKAVRDAGRALLFMGDDLVSQALAYNQSTSSRDLYGLLWVSQWKAGGTTQRGGVVLDVDHPVLKGPAGTVQDFAYYGDMDVSIPAGEGETVLANIFGSQNPAVLVAEQGGQRTVVLLPSLYSTVVNCPASSTEGLVELRKLFSNAVSWLIQW